MKYFKTPFTIAPTENKNNIYMISTLKIPEHCEGN